MGIQVHSFYDYKLATLLIRGGLIGKVSKVIAWSNKNWGYNGAAPLGDDPIPTTLDWNLWLGTSPERPYKKAITILVIGVSWWIMAVLRWVTWAFIFLTPLIMP